MNVKRMLWGLPLALFAAASTGCSLLKVAVATGVLTSMSSRGRSRVAS